MIMHEANQALLCKGFLLLLTGSAQVWNRKFEAGSISSFKQLSERFLDKFVGAKITKKGKTYLKIIC